MASGGGLLAQLRPFSGGRRLFASSKAKLGQTMLRGASKRAYAFEVYGCAAAAGLREVGGVYCYARRIEADAAVPGGRDNGTSFDIGYVGRTADMANQAAEHERLAHFVGHSLDTLLVLRIAEEAIRHDFEQDLIARHNPVLNDLLRGYKGADGVR